jgi:hypothetical protein
MRLALSFFVSFATKMREVPKNVHWVSEALFQRLSGRRVVKSPAASADGSILTKTFSTHELFFGRCVSRWRKMKRIRFADNRDGLP